MFSFQSNGECNHVPDEDCINTCRGEFDQASLPPICTLCNTKRPLLFVDEADISSVESDSRLLTLRLVNLTNTILGMYVCIPYN